MLTCDGLRRAQVAATFLAPPLVGLAAFSSLHFLELLVGPKAAGLAIAEPEELGAPPATMSGCALFRSRSTCTCAHMRRSCLEVRRSRTGTSAPALHWLSTPCRCNHWWVTVLQIRVAALLCHAQASTP